MDEKETPFQSFCVSKNVIDKITSADILAMDTKLPVVFDTGAVWMASKDVLKDLKR